MSIGLTHYLLLAAVLFAIGMFGVLSKRNIIAVMMGIELMLNAVNINALFGKAFGNQFFRTGGSGIVAD